MLFCKWVWFDETVPSNRYLFVRIEKSEQPFWFIRIWFDETIPSIQASSSGPSSLCPPEKQIIGKMFWWFFGYSLVGKMFWWFFWVQFCWQNVLVIFGIKYKTFSNFLSAPFSPVCKSLGQRPLWWPPLSSVHSSYLLSLSPRWLLPTVTRRRLGPIGLYRPRRPLAVRRAVSSQLGRSIVNLAMLYFRNLARKTSCSVNSPHHPVPSLFVCLFRCDWHSMGHMLNRR